MKCLKLISHSLFFVPIFPSNVNGVGMQNAYISLLFMITVLQAQQPIHCL